MQNNNRITDLYILTLVNFWQVQEMKTFSALLKRKGKDVSLFITTFYDSVLAGAPIFKTGWK
jgi:hypothetical protein